MWVVVEHMDSGFQSHSPGMNLVALRKLSTLVYFSSTCKLKLIRTHRLDGRIKWHNSQLASLNKQKHYSDILLLGMLMPQRSRLTKHRAGSQEMENRKPREGG